MAHKMIMQFDIAIDEADITQMTTKNGEVVYIPFTGSVESELFCGTIRPGAADIQVVNPAGVRHMCAKYIFEGKDRAGADCHLYVENNGYFSGGEVKMPFDAVPTFRTDSAELADYLHGAHFRAEGHLSPEGVTIKIFDIDIDIEIDE